MPTIAQLPLGVSTSLFGEPTNQSYIECAQAHISFVEICLPEKWQQMNRDDLITVLKNQEKLAHKNGVSLWSLHLPFGPKEDVSSLEEDVRTAAVNRHIQRMAAAQGTGIQKIVLHGSYEPIVPQNRQAKLYELEKSLQTLHEAAKKHHQQLAIECLPRTCLGNTTHEMLQMLAPFEEIGVCCDTNHLLQDKTEDFIHALGHKVVTLHISDYDGVDERHWLPGTGVNNWKEILAALDKQGYAGPALFELGVKAGQPRPTCMDIRNCWNSLVSDYEKQI